MPVFKDDFSRSLYITAVLPPGLRTAGALSIEVEIEHGQLLLSELTSTQHELGAPWRGFWPDWVETTVSP